MPLLCLLLGAGTVSCTRKGSDSAEQAGSSERPNIIYILADDLAWNDVSFNGSDIQTPVIDGLTAKGVRLDYHYTLPSCTPTRAALLTGRYPIRYGLQNHVVNIKSAYGLPLAERTLPEALKEAGYRTAISGKWHLGHHEPEYLPENRGFDHVYGMYWGRIDYFTHETDKPKHVPGNPLDWHRNGQAVYEEGYSTTLFAREAVKLIEEHDFSQPLFLYVAFNAPHGPVQSTPEHLARIKNIEDPVRKNYAAVVLAIDDAVGEIMKAIEKRDIGENTLVVFTSDNGGMEENGGSNEPLHGKKGELYEGGIRVPSVAVWPGRIEPGSVVEEPIFIADWYPTLLTLAGASLEQKLPLDAKDIWPVLTEGKPTPHQEILLNIDPTRTGSAIRAGDWKLIVPATKKSKNPYIEETELYNIANDPNETRSLVSAHPEKVDELKARLDFYASQAVPPLNSTTKPMKGELPRVIGEYGK